MPTKKYNKRVLIDLDEFQSMLYQRFYPRISHKNSERIIEQMEIMDKKEKPTDGNQ